MEKRKLEDIQCSVQQIQTNLSKLEEERTQFLSIATEITDLCQSNFIPYRELGYYPLSVKDEMDRLENIEKLKEDSCLICATDNLAYGAIKALEESGLSVGENYSVAAFGDYTSSTLLKSPLTTIKFDLKDAAKQTVEMLLNIIKKEETAMKLLIGYELKTRDSVVDLNKMENKND